MPCQWDDGVGAFVSADARVRFYAADFLQRYIRRTYGEQVRVQHGDALCQPCACESNGCRLFFNIMPREEVNGPVNTFLHASSAFLSLSTVRPSARWSRRPRSVGTKSFWRTLI